MTDLEIAAYLETELLRRFWTLFDAAKVISELGYVATPDEWRALHVAVAAIPERQRR